MRFARVITRGRDVRRAGAVAVCVVASVLGVGCSTTPNPSFSVSVRQARNDLEMRVTRPVRLERPVVVISGYLDFGPGVWRTAEMFRRVVEQPGWVLEVPMFSATTFEACRSRTIAKVINAFGPDAAGNTIEVDVVGISMGGLVARYAAMDQPGEPRLRIHELFTISTPHRGATAAELIAPDTRAVAMRPDSPLLRDLDGAFTSANYEIVSYVRLDDGVVGEAQARGPDGRLWWVPDKPFSFAHLDAPYDERIIDDIVRRLAGEAPWTTEPCWPLPTEQKAAKAGAP